jgi:hypothetical protein
LQKSIYDFSCKSSDYLCFGSKFSNQITVIACATLQPYFRVPQIQGFIHSFTNFSLSASTLWIVYDNNKFFGFDLSIKQLTKWSSQNLNKFPLYYLNHFNKLTGILELTANKVMVSCPFFYSIIDLTKAVPQEVPKDTQDARMAASWQLVKRQNPIIGIEFYEDELVLLESSWEELLREMPGAVNTRNYGF